MPRRSILSAAERESLLALPDTKDELIRHYTFSETDLSIIRQRRGPANRLGFAVQLCYLRFPGVILGVDEPPFPPLLKLVADQLKVSVEGVVCGRGRNPTLRLWPTIFSGKIDVFPGDRRSRLISSMTSVAPA
ncbi:DUF4158 domain-containing protein [Serratia marcescens]|uniref:DUF4158 domain-containing protein n=1 Tax=Mycobacteroides abscessus subsp. bolletii CRM-0020 TaxID=1306401 RepID=A0A829HMX2_9MYCO|nr:MULTISPECIES: DUF4158 domain-containing protein [Pseudomonadota]ELT5287544.1 DUF4158 domain-containing protein [Pseudomonas aeruginosa]EPQ20891.1 hypothetical protein J108_24090 [Mycobacteroides abscessus subsp. bolletii CRM-0020]MDU4227216.1 DUF4158 domain-containing protein [Klebsiella grimontii]TEW80203.1 DUF4158 domain-containing protein [Serratia marcescens]MCA8044725.1 DUF4158 domain-containing protein [Burkholderia seminalis]